MRNDALALCTKNKVIIKYLCSICSVDKCPSVGYNIDTFRRGARKMTERKSFDFFALTMLHSSVRMIPALQTTGLRAERVCSEKLQGIGNFNSH